MLLSDLRETGETWSPRNRYLWETVTQPGTPCYGSELRGRTQLQPHLRVPEEGANWGPGPVPWSKVPGSRGTRINYQLKTIGEQGGSAGLDLSSL